MPDLRYGGPSLWRAGTIENMAPFATAVVTCNCRPLPFSRLMLKNFLTMKYRLGSLNLRSYARSLKSTEYRPGVIFLLLIMGLSPEEAIRRVSLCVNLRSFKVIQCKLIEIGRLPIEIRGVYPGGGESNLPHF